MTDAASSAASDDAHRLRLQRMRFRAWRRGFRELDLIMGGFADTHAETMSEAEIADFERLLEEPDQEVYAWIIGAQHTPEEYDTPVMARLKAFEPEKGQGA